MSKCDSFERKIRTFNKRIPMNLTREQDGLAKLLRKERYASNPFKALAETFESIDRTYSYADGLIACKKGCSYCCHMEIGLSQVEADYIADRVGVPAKRLTSQREESNPDGWIDPNKPCPFLRDGVCAIYPFRPMVCRTYVSFEDSNDKCRFDSTSKIHLIDREASLPGVLKAYAELVVQYGGFLGDIRDFFGVSSAVLIR